MIDGFSRRALMGGVLVSWAAMAAPAMAGGGRLVPAGPMVLRRFVERPLGGNAAIRVDRAWEVMFAAGSDGTSVLGHQTHVRVEAPERIAAIAQIEEQRQTDALFPIALDSSGLVISVGNTRDKTVVADAVDTANELFARAHAGKAAVDDARRDLARLQQAGQSVFDRLPQDLFFPEGTPVREVAPIALPGGAQGEFELRYVAHAAADGPWLETAERTVITRIGPDERKSLERWTLAAI